VETYLDASKLTSSQSLVVEDDQGQRWDVLEALNASNRPSETGSRSQKQNSQVTLERWRIELQDIKEQTADFGSTLPTIYKKCIVFFRSLYATAKFVPAWRFVKGSNKTGSANSLLKLNCRILSGGTPSGRFDALTHPLYESTTPATTDYFLGTTETPIGKISAQISYRNDFIFRVDDAESVLSSRLMGVDEHFFQPSLDDKRRRSTRTVEVGSLPTHRQQADDSEPIQAYGSLSTFHGDAPPRGSSPISALRAAKTMGSDTSSPPMGSLPHTSRASLRSLEGATTARRPSVSFQPFKAGSLSSSPGRGILAQQAGDMSAPQSPHSLPRSSGISGLAQARNRSSLTAGMPASLRGAPIAAENAIASSTSSSPRPAPISKYSSSFTHRRGRSSFGGASKLVDDDQVSSGKQSFSSSSVQPGSGILTEPGAGGSSGSLQTDDDNISEFLKLLDSKKTLQSFEPAGGAAAKRTSAQLLKFQTMKESNHALTESMSSSTLLQRSLSSSSRQLSSVPAMVAATSISTSSSPGKPVSPHTPHTPAIPSRLSANSVAEYSVPRRASQQSRTNLESRVENVADEDQAIGLGTNAIDIPTSPRAYFSHTRRSSSVAQQNRSLAIEDDLGELPFGVHRSISLGADDREPPSLSALLGQTSESVATSSRSPAHILQPAPHITEASDTICREASSSLEAHESEAHQVSRGPSAASTSSPYRPRIGRTGGRGVTSPQTGSYSSLLERGSASGSERGGGRYSFTRAVGPYEPDDEPLLFDMSELGRDQSRRSLEEARGGGNAGASSSERGPYDTGRGGDSGISSRKGISRRGW
jgi:autophagy-related protein 13